MIRLIIILLTSLLLPTISSAQTVEEFKDKLSIPTTAPNSYRQVQVIVNEHGDVSRTVKRASMESLKTNIKGYRVCIFFDNAPDARANAEEVKTLFNSQFPEESIYLAYEIPYFKVTVGNCVTNEEGIILMEKVRGTFPKAYIKNENISFEELIITPIVIKPDSISSVDILP